MPEKSAFKELGVEQCVAGKQHGLPGSKKTSINLVIAITGGLGSYRMHR
jgi:hypothetical protein